MKTAQKIINNLINENISPLNVSSLWQNVIFGDNQFMSKYTFHIQITLPPIPVSIGLTIPVHMLNRYEIYLNTTNYPICNMQDLRYWLCTSILEYFGQVVFPLWS